MRKSERATTCHWHSRVQPFTAGTTVTDGGWQFACFRQTATNDKHADDDDGQQLSLNRDTTEKQ